MSPSRRIHPRESGVLLHPTSLPGPFGTGDLGPEAWRFVDWLADAGQSWWQVLPLGPTDEEFSPYRSLSAFAGNPLLVSPELLARDGLATKEEVDECRVSGPTSRARFPEAARRKEGLFRAAWSRFRSLPESASLRERYDAFLEAEGWWLDDHARFLAIRRANGDEPWTEWTRHVTATKRPVREEAALIESEVEYERFLQFLALDQWRALRAHAAERGVRLIGDLPIYVSGDSVDVWANRDLFEVDERGRSLQVAGVPPDYFSATGQLWGNPIYDWETLSLHGHYWWIDRVKALLAQVDLIRLDHFRGFQAYWSVPGDAATAELGRWRRGPGDELFDAIRAGLGGDGELPFIAEDLGFITPPVAALRERQGLPGLAILQFIAAGFEREIPGPEAIGENTVVYTGTHDNDTTRGWLENEIAPYPRRLRKLRRMTPARPETIAWELLELAWRSPARLAVAPIQDVLSLGAEARMNRPGSTQSEHPNWLWRLEDDQLRPEHAARLAQLTAESGRDGSAPTTPGSGVLLAKRPKTDEVV